MRPAPPDSRELCSATTRHGTPCSYRKAPGSQYCTFHSKTNPQISPPEPPAPTIAPIPLPSPSQSASSISERIDSILSSPGFLSLKHEIATLKALLHHYIDLLDSPPEDESTPSDSTLKRIHSLAMDIISSGEKFARFEERRGDVLSKEEIASIIQRLNEKVVHVIRQSTPDTTPEETASLIADAFATILTEESSR